MAINDLVIVASGFRGSYGGAFRLGGRGDLKATQNVALSSDKHMPDLASPDLFWTPPYIRHVKPAFICFLDLPSGDA